MSVRGDNAPICNDGVAGLGPMVRAHVQVSVGADLRPTDHVQWGRPDLIDSKLQAMTTQSTAIIG